MKDPREVIIRPVITEHSYDMMEKNTYTFEVAKEANKVEIRQVEDGWQITLTITDIGSDLMSVTIFMPTRDACERIRHRFLNDPMLTYKGVFALLTGDTKTVGELVSSQEDLFQD